MIFARTLTNSRMENVSELDIMIKKVKSTKVIFIKACLRDKVPKYIYTGELKA